MSWLESIFGSPKPTIASAPALASYPSEEDAQFARTSGFGYGTPVEPFIEGHLARVFGSLAPDAVSGNKTKLRTFVPQSAAGMTTGEATAAVDNGGSMNLDLRDPRNAAVAEKVRDYFARAALAANRSTVAAVGFDPRRAAIDVQMQNPTIGGAYNPGKDSIYAVASDPSALVHESMHRGMRILRENPELATAFKSLPTEESVVRFLMATQAGDPEANGGSIDKQQRSQGLTSMDTPTRRAALKSIEEAGQRLIASRNPRGPR